MREKVGSYMPIEGRNRCIEGRNGRTYNAKKRPLIMSEKTDYKVLEYEGDLMMVVAYTHAKSDMMTEEMRLYLLEAGFRAGKSCVQQGRIFAMYAEHIRGKCGGGNVGRMEETARTSVESKLKKGVSALGAMSLALGGVDASETMSAGRKANTERLGWKEKLVQACRRIYEAVKVTTTTQQYAQRRFATYSRHNHYYNYVLSTMMMMACQVSDLYCCYEHCISKYGGSSSSSQYSE